MHCIPAIIARLVPKSRSILSRKAWQQHIKATEEADASLAEDSSRHISQERFFLFVLTSSQELCSRLRRQVGL